MLHFPLVLMNRLNQNRVCFLHCRFFLFSERSVFPDYFGSNGKCVCDHEGSYMSVHVLLFIRFFKRDGKRVISSFICCHEDTSADHLTRVCIKKNTE